MSSTLLSPPRPDDYVDAIEAAAEPGFHAPPPVHGFFRTYVWSQDHKMIGLQYLFASLFFMAFSGLLVMVVRWQLAFPGQPVPFIGHLLPGSIAGPDGAVQPGGYNALVTMHATIMVFLGVMPLFMGAFANFIIPLQIGARDMAFPFFNALSFWLFLLSGVVMMASFFVPGGASASGWTAYAPLSSDGRYNDFHAGQSVWVVALFINGLASITGAANYVTTIANMRCPGMTMFRLPLTVWGLFVTSFILLVIIPILAAAATMLVFDLNFGTRFFSGDNLAGGQPLLWQHLFWYFGHPEVYVLILPAMGVISDILSNFSRKPIFGYRAMVFSMVAIASLGQLVWAHHMFVSGMSLVLGAMFSVSSLVIAVPSAIKTFNWMGTIWNGSLRFTVPMCYATAFVTIFVAGGLTGLFVASTPINLFVHNTYFVVAHFHYVMAGSTLLAVFAGITFWFPKMFGRMMNETLGYWHFWLFVIFFNLTFFPMHNVGLAGMMRRIADPTQYQHLSALQPIQMFITHSAFGLGLSTLLFGWNFFHSMFYGKQATDNPWRANTLEWTLPSPVRRHGNFEHTPRVYRGPHEYSVPGMREDFLMQNVPPSQLPREAAAAVAAMDAMHI